MTKSALDAFDQALLAQVQRDNQTPARVLAARIGLSESAVLRRLRQLRKTGVIVADVAVVRPSSLGHPLTIICLVALEREGLAHLDAFGRGMRDRPEVRQCWYVTGEADFVVVLQMPSMERYEAFTREAFLADPNVRSFKTMVAMREMVGTGSARPMPAVANTSAQRGIVSNAASAVGGRGR